MFHFKWIIYPLSYSVFGFLQTKDFIGFALIIGRLSVKVLNRIQIHEKLPEKH